VRFVVLACLAVACQPGLDGTAFRCDDSHGCPDDQSCIIGRCRRIPPSEIGCGSVTCAGNEQCCVDSENPPRCIAAADICPGRDAVCDGVDDCATTEHCCNGDTTACGLDCQETACTTDTDCPSTEPHCCPQSDVPWGQCQLEGC
jgi:hypothetical protein